MSGREKLLESFFIPWCWYSSRICSLVGAWPLRLTLSRFEVNVRAEVSPVAAFFSISSSSWAALLNRFWTLYSCCRLFLILSVQYFSFLVTLTSKLQLDQQRNIKLNLICSLARVCTLMALPFCLLFMDFRRPADSAILDSCSIAFFSSTMYWYQFWMNIAIRPASVAPFMRSRTIFAFSFFFFSISFSCCSVALTLSSNSLSFL
mmetsp:Transcript_17875/g.53898  ORF Transcript_17875/g.53898 Transcript_17875/m.53898 type:complete len:205 (+) Transcript_17875:159-773(+)